MPLLIVRRACDRKNSQTLKGANTADFTVRSEGEEEEGRDVPPLGERDGNEGKNDEDRNLHSVL